MAHTTNYKGEVEINELTVAKFEECLDECNQASVCQIWTYAYDNHACKIYEEATGIEYQSNFLSGTKNCVVGSLRGRVIIKDMKYNNLSEKIKY